MSLLFVSHRADRLWRSSLARNVVARGLDLAAAGLGTLLVARWGGAAAVGIFAILRMLPGTVATITTGGLPGAVPFFLAKSERDDRLAPTFLLVAATGTLFGFGLWVAAAPLVARYFLAGLATSLVLASGLRVFTYLGFASGRACLQGLGDLDASNWTIVGEDLFFIPCFLTAVALRLPVPVALVASILAGDVANGVLAWAILLHHGFLRRVRPPSLRLAVRVFVFGCRGQVGNLMLLLNFRLDFAILAAIAGPAVLGVYAVASRFAELLRLLPLSVFWVLYPSYAKARRGDAVEREAKKALPRIAVLSLAGALPLAAAAFALPWIFGPAFNAAILPAQILLIGLVAEGAGGVATPYLYGKGRPGLNSIGMGAGVVVTVVLDVLLIPRHGAVGAAIASSAAYATASLTLLLLFAWVAARSRRPSTEAAPFAPEAPTAAQGEGRRRVLDIAGALALLFLAAPVLVAAALAIRLSDGPPVLYRSTRSGRDGRPFTMLKLRTMRSSPTAAGSITAAQDKRVFPVGRVLRKVKVDELPQLINVLRGDMALVGPRPEDPGVLARWYRGEDLTTLTVRPGLTSPGTLFYYAHCEKQLLGSDVENTYGERVLPLKLALDRVYLRRAGVGYDLWLLARTAWTLALMLLARAPGDPPEMAEARALLTPDRGRAAAAGGEGTMP